MNDPKRLILTESNELGLAVASARRQLPNEDQLAALATRLSQLGAPIPPESGLLEPKSGLFQAAPGGAPTALGPFIKIGLAMLSGLGLMAALVLGLRSPATVVAPSPAPSSERLAVNTAETATRPTEAPLPAAAPAASDVESLEASDRQSPLPSRDSSGRGLVPPAPSSASSLEALPPVAPTLVAPPRASERAPTDAPGPVNRTNTKARSQASGDTRDFDGEPAAMQGRVASSSEIELLKQARAALSGDPLQAYVLTERCRAEYPRGAFAQERDFISITALSRVGRVQQARAQARLFRQHYPRSAYLPQLDRMFEEP